MIAKVSSVTSSVLKDLYADRNPSFQSLDAEEDWARVEKASDVKSMPKAHILNGMEEWIKRSKGRSTKFSFHANALTSLEVLGQDSTYLDWPVVIDVNMPDGWIVLNADASGSDQTPEDGVVYGSAMYGRVSIPSDSIRWFTRDLSDVRTSGVAEDVLNDLYKGIVNENEDANTKTPEALDSLLEKMNGWINRTEHRGNTFSFHANAKTAEFAFGTETKYRGRPIIVDNKMPDGWLLMNADMNEGCMTAHALKKTPDEIVGGAMLGRIELN